MLHAFIDRFCGCRLKLRIKRGIDAQTLLVIFRIAQLLNDLIANKIYEIWRLIGIDALCRQFQRTGFRYFCLFLGNGAGLHHRVQHNIAARHCPGRMSIWIQAAGTLNQARE